MSLLLILAAAGVDPAAAVPRPAMPMSRAAHRAFRDAEFAAMDRNRDGVLQRGELRLRAKALGAPTTDEALRRAMRINCGRPVRACRSESFHRQGDAEFDRVDADGDGVVTATELAEAGGSFHADKF